MTENDLKHKVSSRAFKILEIAQRMASDVDCDNLEDIQLHFDGYAEPNYSNPESGIIATGNWNNVTKWNPAKNEPVLISDLPSRVGNLFQKMGIECEWCDEWKSCSNCNKLVRTCADSYSWQPSFVSGAGPLLCHECVTESDDSVIEYLESLEGNTHSCLTLDIDPTKFGYVQYNETEYESGWYGTVDHPEDVAKELKEKGIERFFFQLSENQQFCSRWNVWIKEESEEV